MKMISNQEGNVLLLFLIGIFILVFLVIEVMYQDLLWMENQISLENEEYLNNLLESGYALAVVELYQIDRETINDIEVRTIHYDNITYKLEYILSTTEDGIMDIIVSMPYLTKKYLKVKFDYFNRSIILWEELFSS